jgi:methionine synthase II (cobalamin-independent)
MGIGVKDQNGRSLFYDDTLRDALVKTIAMKAYWQVENLKPLSPNRIIFFDEPGIVSFGSSSFISITREQIHAVLEEVIAAVHAAGGLAGIHICANGDWSLALEASIDIISFDAYNYFDKFILYPDLLKKFLAAGKTIAWGIVPTANPEDVAKETADSLIRKWQEQAVKIEALGIDRKQLMSQTLITPSCGTGSLTLQLATKVLEMTKEVSEKLRSTQGV